MQHKWGCQVPNGNFNPDDVVEVFGDGVYVIMQGEFNKLPALRNKAPKAFILGRFYLPNWYVTVPSVWANEIEQILTQVNASDDQHRRNMDMLDAYTWANEQNLRHESGNAIGAPGMERGHYEIIRDWNVSFLDSVDNRPAIREFHRVFPALAMGNSDDQDDGAGVGLDVLQPVIKRCHYGAIHPYWKPDKPLDDPWYGLGRIHKQLPFFKGRPVIAKETGNFAVTRQDSPDQYVAAGYYMQGIKQIWPGFTFFIFADPTKQHQDNDMSRNTGIFDAIKRATKIERGTWESPVEPPVDPDPTPEPPTDPDPTPEPNPPPFEPARKCRVAYQIWQWSELRQIANYDHLKHHMDLCGATILADKYADSDALQGRFDNDPMAVKSIQVMKDRKAWCEDNGFIYMPWDVPRAIPINGNAFEGARQESLFHARVCNEVGLKYRVSDLEFYKSFFGYDLEHRGGRSFFNNMQERNDAAELYYRTFAENSGTKTILQPDPRQWGTIQFERLVPYLDSIVWQSYAYWFQMVGDGRDHAEIIADALNKSKTLGVPTHGLSLYSEMGTPRDTPAHLVRQFCQQAIDGGARYVFVYKAPIDDTVSPVLKEFAELRESGDNVDLIQDVNNGAWHFGNQLEHIGTEYEKLAERAQALGYKWMANAYAALAKDVQAAAALSKAATKIPKD